jgi:hypothetical protein
MDNALSVYLTLIHQYKFLGYLPAGIVNQIKEHYNVSTELLQEIYKYAKSL